MDLLRSYTSLEKISNEVLSAYLANNMAQQVEGGLLGVLVRPQRSSESLRSLLISNHDVIGNYSVCRLRNGSNFSQRYYSVSFVMSQGDTAVSSRLVPSPLARWWLCPPVTLQWWKMNLSNRVWWGTFLIHTIWPWINITSQLIIRRWACAVGR